MKEPLSKSLKQLIDGAPPEAPTLNHLLEATGERGLQLVIVFMALPFCLPILPGVSTPFGLAIVFLGVRQMLNVPGRLPRFIGDREFRPETFQKVLRGGVRIVGWVEKATHPRGGDWLTTAAARRFHAFVICLMGLLMSLPLPVPLTNTIPAWAILIIAASTSESDGRLIWLGHLVAAGAIAYFIFVWNAVEEMARRIAAWFSG